MQKGNVFIMDEFWEVFF